MTKINVYGIRGFPNVQGGVEKHCEELYPKMASKNFNFKIFRRKPYIDKTYKHIEFQDVGTVKTDYLETVVHSTLCAFKTIRQRPDIVHIHNIGPAMTLPLIKMFGIKSVVTLHSPNYEHAKWNFLARCMLKFSEKIAFRLSDKLIFVSNVYKKKAIENSGLNKNKAVLIPNGLTDFDSLTPNITLKDYNLKKEEYILFVGRIVPEKRIHDLISAFSKINTNMKLVIVGSHDNNKNYFNTLFKFREQLKNRLVFTGKLDSNNVKLLYQNAYCFVLPSENEGMPIVLLEAMSFGKCALVSDIQENLDVVENLGFFFKVKDENDLQKKLEHMLANKTEVNKKGLACKKLVTDQYNWDTIAKQTLNVYKEVLEEKKKQKKVNE